MILRPWPMYPWLLGFNVPCSVYSVPMVVTSIVLDEMSNGRPRPRTKGQQLRCAPRMALLCCTLLSLLPFSQLCPIIRLQCSGWPCALQSFFWSAQGSSATWLCADPTIITRYVNKQTHIFSRGKNTLKNPKNQFQGINSASLCILSGRYDNPIPTQCPAPIDCSKNPAPQKKTAFFFRHTWLQGKNFHGICLEILFPR